MGLYQKALQAAIETAREAGDLLRREFHRHGGPRGTAHHAEADEAAEILIRERLLAVEPWNYLGEETGALHADSDHLWLVDPNDGTFAYMRGMRGSAVSIAGLREGVPILGVVFAFAYPDDDGDLIAWAEGCGPVMRNGRPVGFSLQGLKLGRETVVLVSQDADKNPGANLQCVSPARFRAVPSIAYRLALTAVGEGVAAVSLNGPKSWDYGASHALLRGAGGVLVDQDGMEVRYMQDGRSHVLNCFGGAPEAARELARRSWDSVFNNPSNTDNSMFGLSRMIPGRSVRDAGQLAHAQGCVLGQLAGDALGAQVEFLTRSSIRLRFPEGVREIRDGGTFDTIAGQPTDDSEMALMLARCLVREGRYDRGAALDAYVHWYRSGPFDMGVTTRLALEAALGGGNREERLRLVAESANSESEANGSLMRVSPLGVFGSARLGEVATWGREDSSLTHPNPVCCEACAAFVSAIAAAVSGAGPVECHRVALETARRANAGEVVSALETAAVRGPEKMEGYHSGWVLLALQNAFYWLLNSDSLEEALVKTVSSGGDADTNAAICGALLGAVYGRDAVPPRWRDCLLSCRPMAECGAKHPRPSDFWPIDALQLAELLMLAGMEGRRDG